MLPILLNTQSKVVKALIAGGGKVALRRTEWLIQSGVVNIDLISPELHPDFADLANTINHCKTEYISQNLKDYTLVLACTEKREVNDLVEQDARAANILFNRADRPESSDFHIPGTIFKGKTTISINTGVPALTKALKERIESEIPETIFIHSELLNKLRLALKENNIETAVMKSTLTYFADSKHLDALSEIDFESLDSLKNNLIKP